MAKVRSILNLSGTLSGMTFVDSNAYGAHVRAKRGTYKPISLAEGMKESAAVQTQVNLMAKIIFDSVSGFSPGFKDGKFWTRLLAVFRRQKKAGSNYNYSDFNLMEVRMDYPASKHGTFRLVNDEHNGVLLNYHLYKNENYRIRLLRISTDETLLTPYPNQVQERDIIDGKATGNLKFDFCLLPEDAAILYVLHCERLINGATTALLKSKGLTFLTAG